MPAKKKKGKKKKGGKKKVKDTGPLAIVEVDPLQATGGKGHCSRPNCKCTYFVGKTINFSLS